MRRPIAMAALLSALTVVAASAGVAPASAAIGDNPYPTVQEAYCSYDQGVNVIGYYQPPSWAAEVDWRVYRINPHGRERQDTFINFWNKRTGRYDLIPGASFQSQVRNPLFPLEANWNDYKFVFSNVDFPALQADDNYYISIWYGYWIEPPGGSWQWRGWYQHFLQPPSLANPVGEYGHAAPEPGAVGLLGDRDCHFGIRSSFGIGVPCLSSGCFTASSASTATVPMAGARLRGLARGESQLLRAAPASPAAAESGSAKTQTGCLGARPTIVGTDGADTLVGTADRDVIAGLGGDDTIFGLGGSDVICGGDGNDGIAGGDGADRLAGQDGDDTLLGGGASDVILGGGGTDIVEGGAGADHLVGGGQPLDILAYLFSSAGVSVDLGTGTARGGEGRDAINGFNAVVGSNFADHLTGTSGDQWFVPLAGNDTVHGGSGTDVISYFLASEGIRASLASGHAEGEGSDRLDGVEVIFGSSHDDVLTGDRGPNWLFGDAGNDLLDGAAGSNTLEGDAGTDVCVSGTFYSGCENQGDGVIGPTLEIPQSPRPSA